MTATPVFVGLDVAKLTLDVALRPSGEQWSVSNDEPGATALLERLRPLVPTLVVCEATGGFERAAIATLAAAGLPVVVANPRQIRDFARATGQLAKTDQLDAALLALFSERVRPTPRPTRRPSCWMRCSRGAGSSSRCSWPRRTEWALRPSRCTAGSRPTSAGSTT